MVNYDFCKKIEDKSNLAALFNRVMEETLFLRITCAPKSFQEMKEHEEHIVPHFYEMCLCEMWMHRVIDMLREWDKLLEEYFTEFSGSWKFYALSRKIDSIKEYGSADDEDYNEDGSVKNSFPDEKLIPYSIIKELIPGDCKDIVIDSDANDLMVIPNSIMIASQIHVDEIIERVFGEGLTMYKTNEKGDMVPITTIEKSLGKINREANGEELALLMKGIILSLWATCLLVRKAFNPTEDNVEQLEALHKYVKNMLNLDECLIDNIRENLKNN